MGIEIQQNHDINKYISNISKLLIEDISIEKKFKIKGNQFVIKPKGPYFSSSSVLYIARVFKNIINKYKYLNLNIILNLRSIEVFSDKNTYLFLDLLIYYLFYNSSNHIKLYIEIDIGLSNVIHNGLINTTFMRVLNVTDDGQHLDRRMFIEKYVDFLNGKPIEMNNVKPEKSDNFYRKLITKHSFEDITESIIATEISCILKVYYDDENWVDDVVDAISEIVSNVYSHNNEFMLIDIDICNDVRGIGDMKGNGVKFSALNISILNLGKELLYGTIKQNIKEKRYSHDTEVYNRVYKAYDNHRDKFNEKYSENHFFSITAFQRRVSTRDLDASHSGTGLTRLIQNIIGKTEDDISYVMSGNIGLGFREKFMNVSDNGLIGFNENNDYINQQPDDSILVSTDFYIPGTIYQLHLIKEV